MMSQSPNIAIAAISDLVLLQAKQLATALKLPLVAATCRDHRFSLLVTPERLELIQPGFKPIYVDFLSAAMQYRCHHGGGKKQLIAKAVGIKGKNLPTVLDATAGFGSDAFQLAMLGCEVVMLERSPIMHALLADGLRRLYANPIAKNLKISLHFLQSVDYINNFIYMKPNGAGGIDTWVNPNRERGNYSAEPFLRPEVIYLDPMYPNEDKSALNKRPMRVLRELVGDDSDAEQLLAAALTCATKRVVVKRPRLAPILSVKPHLSFSSGQSCRYDIYFVQARG